MSYKRNPSGKTNISGMSLSPVCGILLSTVTSHLPQILKPKTRGSIPVDLQESVRFQVKRKAMQGLRTKTSTPLIILELSEYIGRENSVDPAANIRLV